ncbi:MAG: hypothetical protein FPO08_10520 [Geobacter sp.]|nr:MAG: hypothetical protein FPO08_10520 [Geobacter sp.]
MQRLRHCFIVLGLLLCLSTTATASVSVGIGIGLPNVSIGINLGGYPDLRPIPGYPVYYAPNVPGNYFFYDGMYWSFWNDNWYVSSWYNGPWALVDPYVVPVYILRVPVRYYVEPPVYFRSWAPNYPPRWGQHWGRGWEDRRHGWDRWDRSRTPGRAPLPTYQRRYTGDRYPSTYEQQQRVRRDSYRYQPKSTVVRQHLREVERRPSGPPARQERPEMRGPGAMPPAQMQRGPERERQAPMQHEPRMQPPAQHAPKAMEPPRGHEPRIEQRMEPRQERMQERMERGGGPERGGGQGRGRGQDKDDERGR